MDGTYKDFLASGRSLITDTKTAKVKSESVKKAKTGFDTPPLEKDPHRVLIRRCIDDRIKKSDVVEELKKFIETAENAM
jgi:hypothetical protein